MEKIVEQGLLYDFYGPLLTEHQQRIYEKAVYDNLSLSEIAQSEGISKQAVHDLIRRCTASMRDYEQKLGMMERFNRIRTDADRLLAQAQQAGEGSIPAEDVRRMAMIIKEDLH